MVNQSVGDFLRCPPSEHPRRWDVVIAQAEFAFNNAINLSTGLSAFQIVLGMSPNILIDLAELPLTVPTCPSAPI